MVSLVFHQFLVGVKGCRAMPAMKLFYAGVNELVSLETTFWYERPRAFGAIESHALVVLLLVGSKIARHRKANVADVARVRFNFGVYFFVAGQGIFSYETLTWKLHV